LVLSIIGEGMGPNDFELNLSICISQSCSLIVLQLHASTTVL
jgi:hypothetical protein